MDTSLLATIIGGIAAVIGLGMAAIAIIASRSMKATQSGQETAGDGQTPVSAAERDQGVAIDGKGNLTDTDSDPATNDPNAFTDPFSPDVASDPNAFTDPFAPEATTEEDGPEVWGSVFDDPAEQTETKWGFDGEDAREPARDEIRPETREK